ncbi:MAG: lipoate--protein ligase family protein [Bacteroidetes bacterium]|nr:lipoate--protein ligase family protein [Bacteroidota bacterium]
MHTAATTHKAAMAGAGNERTYSGEWLYAVDHDLSGEQNMARDEAMAIACGRDGVPRLRFYSWQPYTLSLGHNQSDAAIDRRGIDSKGYGIVRRPTGGRAVFHAEELTYAVAMPSNGDGIHATYSRITEAVMRGLEILGAHDLEFSRSQPDFREHYTLEESESCFSASALNELTWHGRKLLGSAQRRYGGVLLQHGSLLVGDAHLEIIDLLYPEHDASRRGALKSRLAERTATVCDLLNGRVPAFDSLASALHDGFAATFGAALRRTDDLTTTTTSTHAAEHAS